ncbi:MAG: hypothetical protein Q9M08_08495, partial [Mariprofundus sp.]|nr:hypothetical protein [Mariprofundus sp.]
LSNNKDHKDLCKHLWFNYFKKPLDNLDDDWNKVLAYLRRYFFECEWHEAYDFIEFIAINFKKHQFHEKFTKSCNALLEKEMSAYRFVDGKVTQITEQHEVAEIEQAIENNEGPVRSHLRRALELLSDREAPDYRNSIKESISAVESFVGITVGKEKGTLGQLLKRLETDFGLHPALKKAFSSLYGYTSDEGGIRHAMTSLTEIDFNDAKFMLVVCSAFINFVEGKIED